MKGGPQTWDELEEEPISVKRACISLDGTRIAAVFADKTLCIYDTTTGDAILSPFKVDEYPRSVIFSRDGKLVASGGQALRLWNVETGNEVESFDINVYSLALSPNGSCIAAGCEGIGKPYADKREVLDGSYNIRVINFQLEKISHAPNIFMLDPSGPGRRRVTRLNGEVSPSPFEGHRNQVNSVAYSADGMLIASSSDDQTVRVWDVSNGSRRTFKAHSKWIHSVAFSPDGTQIVSDTGLFNLFTGNFTPHAFGNTEQEVLSFAFSADGRFLASGSFSAACQIWDMKSHQTVVRLLGHTDDVTSVASFPDGKQLMSASKDGTIRVWDIELLENRGETVGWRIDLNVDKHWILGPDKEHFLWVPLPIQHARNPLIIGRYLKIDFANFVHGDEWWKCGEPLQRKRQEESTRDRGDPQGIEVISETLIFFFLTGYAVELKRVICHHLIPHSSFILLFLCLCSLALSLVPLSLEVRVLVDQFSVQYYVYGLHGRAIAFPFAQIFN